MFWPPVGAFCADENENIGPEPGAALLLGWGWLNGLSDGFLVADPAIGRSAGAANIVFGCAAGAAGNENDGLDDDAPAVEGGAKGFEAAAAVRVGTGSDGLAKGLGIGVGAAEAGAAKGFGVDC